MDSDAATTEVSGAQAIARAAKLLRFVARGPVSGSSLTELAVLTGIPHPTVRRMLLALAHERMVEQVPATRRYRLGPLFVEYSHTADHRQRLKDMCHPHLRRVAQMTGGTAYLVVRSGSESLCIDRAEGSDPIRAVTIEIGGRRAFGLGSSNQALLANFDDDEIEALLAANRTSIERNPFTSVVAIRQAVKEIRIKGYSLVRDLTAEGVSAVGCACSEVHGMPSAAISVGMITARLTPEKAEDIGRLLRSVWSEIEAEWAQGTWQVADIQDFRKHGG